MLGNGDSVRTRVVKDRGARRSYFEVRFGRREELDVRRIGALRDVRCQALLVPAEVPREQDEALYFDVTGLVSLREYVRRDVLSHQKYERLLASVAELVSTCDALGIDVADVLCDDTRIFASFDGVLHAAYVPLLHGEHPSSTTVLSLVGTMGNARRLRFYLEEDERIARAVARFHDESEFFDLERYCALLGDEFGVVQRTLRNPRISRIQNRKGVVASRRVGEDVGARSCGAARTPVPSEKEDTPVPDPESRPFVLVRIDTGERYALADDELLTLGRSGTCSVQLLGNPDLSRRQATLLCEDDGCVVCDLGSANGTVVRGHRLGESEEARLAFGETFQLAGEPFVIVRGR